MKRLLLGFVCTSLAAALRPEVKRGEGFGDQDYEYVKVEFASFGVELSWW